MTQWKCKLLNINLLYKRTHTHLHSSLTLFASLFIFPLINRKVLICTLLSITISAPFISPSPYDISSHWFLLYPCLSTLICSQFSLLFFHSAHSLSESSSRRPSLDLKGPALNPHSLSIRVLADRISTAPVACLNLYLAPRLKQNQTESNKQGFHYLLKTNSWFNVSMVKEAAMINIVHSVV